MENIPGYLKMAIPFLAGILCLLTAYGDQEKGWKWFVAILSALFFFGAGCIGILVR